MILPEQSVRHFATWFFQFKNGFLATDRRRSSKHPATWEKKGTQVFTPKNLKRYAATRRAGLRLLNRVKSDGGKIFFYGREKHQSPTDSNASGLHTTILSHSVRRIDRFCDVENQNFMMILDQHSQRIKLLESAAKTMFGALPARRLLEPPFEVESHLYQTVQAADWIAAIAGRVWAYRLSPTEFSDHKIADDVFGVRLSRLSTHSTVLRAPTAQGRLNLQST